ncbi:MAG: hypothetical protein DMD72_13690 [Gemmatimonadetes bacterium]|nr:MAG: hypothetical protein DMD72_13690 [Gemmatimonadota bacterium]
MRRFLLCVAVSAALGCERSTPTVDQSLPQTSAASASPVTTAAPSSSTNSTTCPRTGKWALCSVEKRLKQSGFVIKPLEGRPPRRAGFSVSPAVYTLGRSRLEVFIYSDSSALAHDVAGLDTLSAAPRGVPSPWPMQPTFVRSGNLLAVLLTDSQQQAERLNLALTAGAPQP